MLLLRATLCIFILRIIWVNFLCEDKKFLSIVDKHMLFTLVKMYKNFKYCYWSFHLKLINQYQLKMFYFVKEKKNTINRIEWNDDIRYISKIISNVLLFIIMAKKIATHLIGHHVSFLLIWYFEVISVCTKEYFWYLKSKLLFSYLSWNITREFPWQFLVPL